MSSPAIDYDALAKQHGAVASSGEVDYAALAKTNGAVQSDPAKGQELPSVSTQVMKSIHDQAKGLFDTLSGLVDPHMGLKIGEGAIDAQVAEWKRAKENYAKGDYLGAVTGGLGAAIPIIGPLINQTADKLATPGRRAEGLTDILAPVAIGEAVPAVADAARGAVRSVGDAVAPRLYQSALKPGVADAATLSDVRGAVSTGLENQIPVSEAGASKLQTLLSGYGAKVRDLVDKAAQRGATVDPNAVSSRVDQIKPGVGNQVNPKADLGDIEKAKQEFLSQNTVTTPASTVLSPSGAPATAASKTVRMIPLDIAQQLKEGTYQRLQGKYGELGSAAVEAQKALVRGLKEEIEAAEPAVVTPNNAMGKLLDLKPALERAIRRLGNADIVKLGDEAAGAGGAIAGGAPGAAAGFALNKIFGSPELKSRLALAISRGSMAAGKPITWSKARLRAAEVLGKIASQGNADDSQDGSTDAPTISASR